MSGRGSRTYKSWAAMWQRCTNPNVHNYHEYGGRGITVCERWQDFSNFHKDMGVRPQGMSLNRLNNDGNYEPDNCNWATRTDQSRNRRYTVEARITLANLKRNKS